MRRTRKNNRRHTRKNLGGTKSRSVKKSDILKQKSEMYKQLDVTKSLLALSKTDPNRKIKTKKIPDTRKDVAKSLLDLSKSIPN